MNFVLCIKTRSLRELSEEIWRLSYHKSHPESYYLNGYTSTPVLLKPTLLFFPGILSYGWSYAEYSISSDILLQFESWKAPMWVCTSPGQMDKLRLFILQDWHLAMKDTLGQLLPIVMWSTLTVHYNLIRLCDHEMFLQT